MVRRLVVLVTIAIASLAIGQSAWAIGGSITARFNHDTENFQGKVRSSDSECRVNRVVKVFELTADGRQLQGKTRTNDGGGWKVHVMEAEGMYVAVAPKYESMHGTCDRLASEAVDVM
ncbi:MAG TPA: hypothetical protein VIE12_09370 [Actinomycetota bacterium]|jgi:hypothetical protein